MEIKLTLKETIYSLAIKYFKDKEVEDIAKFNIDVLVRNGINYKEYVAYVKTTLKRFLMLFPEIFVLELTNIDGCNHCCYRLNKKLLIIKEEYKWHLWNPKK